MPLGREIVLLRKGEKDEVCSAKVPAAARWSVLWCVREHIYVDFMLEGDIRCQDRSGVLAAIQGKNEGSALVVRSKIANDQK